MTSEQLKEKLDKELVIKILEAIGCHSIKTQKIKGKHVVIAANKDGTNTSAINIHLDNFFARNYTRQEFEAKPYKDIITLVEFIENINCFQAIKRICDICGFSYYNTVDVIPKVLKWLSFVETGSSSNIDDDVLTPLPEKILKQFISKSNSLWCVEGISTRSQKYFQIGFDLLTERITIPIRDELGNLVGVKGRLFDDNNINDDKYIYLYNCPKSKILYGLDKNYKHIKKKNEVIVVEGEKSVIKLHSLGYKNVVAVGSKHISKVQVEKLLRLCVPITIAFDKDVNDQEISNIVNELKYPINFYDVFVIKDTLDLLSTKESPMDDAETWDVLYNNYKVKV